jgi:hypothetical protein
VEGSVIGAEAAGAWREALSAFPAIDVCQTPEYHLAYATRTEGGRPVLWRFDLGGERLCYPFLIAPAAWTRADGTREDTGYRDISGIYGYSGPLSTTVDAGFLAEAWEAFGAWAAEAKVVAEFIRFSPHAGTERFAPPGCRVEDNRTIAVSRLPATAEALFEALDAKTRNMIRKAGKAGLEARELEPGPWIPRFRVLYDETMARNASPGFFAYDDAYYGRLLALPAGELRLFGVFQGAEMVASSIALAHGRGALYHLGASRKEFSNLGANNLCLYAMGSALIASKVAFLNLGGGRTTAPDDPLLRFKRSNGTGTETYRIGRRVLDAEGYAAVQGRWRATMGAEPDPARTVFWR